MKPLSPQREGELFIGMGTILWSLFPIVTVLSFSSLPPLLSLSGSSFFAALFFGTVVVIKKEWGQLRNRKALGDILLATLILGVLYYVFYFSGLRSTSPGNASIIALTEIFFSFVFFHVWNKEWIPPKHVVGALLMVCGAGIVLYPNIHGIHIGDMLIVSASLIAPLGNFFQRRARLTVSSSTILFIRSLIAGIFTFILASLFHQSASILQLNSSMIFLAINGLIILGFSKLLWVEAIHRISVTKGNALSAISPLLTLLFAWIFLHQHATHYQLLSIIPMIIGVRLLSAKEKE